MSYCRWSSDKSQCDIYAYEAEEGYVIHVRSQRPVNSHILPDMPWATLQDFVNLPYEERIEIINTWQKEHKEAVERLVWEDIGLPYDDRTFGFDTEGEMFEFMKELRKTGYYIPSGVCPEMIGEGVE